MNFFGEKWKSDFFSQTIPHIYRQSNNFSKKKYKKTQTQLLLLQPPRIRYFTATWLTFCLLRLLHDAFHCATRQKVPRVSEPSADPTREASLPLARCQTAVCLAGPTPPLCVTRCESSYSLLSRSLPPIKRKRKKRDAAPRYLRQFSCWFDRTCICFYSLSCRI